MKWATEEDASKLLNSLLKPSLLCLVRECLAQLRETSSKENKMLESLSHLSTSFSDFKSSFLPEIKMKLDETCSNINRDIEPLRSGVEAITKSVTSIAEYAEVTTKLDEIKATMPSMIATAPRHQATSLSNNSTDKIIRVRGVPEPSGDRMDQLKMDKDAIDKIFSHLEVKCEIQDLKRVGIHSAEKCRTLLVTVDSTMNKRLLLSAVAKLKTYQIPVFISRDLNYEERQLENSLLKKRRELINDGTDPKTIRYRNMQLSLKQDTGWVPVTIEN